MFDVSQNLKHLFKRPNGSIEFLDGLRAILSLWVLTFHTIWFWGNYYTEADLPGFFADPYLRIFLRGVFGVNGFFVLSGFLITRILIKELEKTGKIAFQRFYVRRLWRLWPAYIFAIVVYFFTIGDHSESLWANLFYLNNFLPFETQAFPWGWSLAIEEQFYLVAPLFIFWFFKIRSLKKKIVWSISLLAIAVLIRATLSYLNPDQGVSLHPTLQPEFYRWHFDHLYDKLWVRYGELLLGVMIAFFHVHPIWHKIRKFLIILILFVIGTLFINFPLVFDFSTSEAVFSVTVVQFIVPVGISALILVGLMNQKSWLFKILGQKFWYPMAQLSYSLYLIHPIVIHLYFHYLKPDTQSLVNYSSVMVSLGIVTGLSLLSSVLIYLFIERPFLNFRDKIS